VASELRAEISLGKLWLSNAGLSSRVHSRGPTSTGLPFHLMTSQQGGFSGLGAVTETMAIFRLEF